MARYKNRVMTAGVASAFSLALAVAGGVPAGAAPASGTAASIQDVDGVWLTSLAGFQAGDPVNWQHRVTVRKVKGAAAVAFEEWRDCAGHAVACKAGKATGGDWSAPSRVLLVMDPKGTVHGIGATGTLELTRGEDGWTEMVLSAGQQPDWMVTPAPATTGQSTASRQAQALQAQWHGSYVGTGACTINITPPKP
ncbi:MAG: hypothetical protein F2836_04880 [Actinobacteria bacterium]|uniref:Unannotated protein n=1 Tax=freshwater metagenome TaxID=449393 RepID=A0A6J7IZJ1_9ZZZZ|nr:hypothetical protein [Actinomycetota bacterium]